ncbi:hypothetical protein ACIOWG_26530 [Streptomyces sp. NPDC087658]|uniref:hypothetical protein n=1 Tax=Streptomyces sp. NPDC087658 TaxID=3365800 RepID=UPI0038029F12
MTEGLRTRSSTRSPPGTGFRPPPGSTAASIAVRNRAPSSAYTSPGRTRAAMARRRS